MLFRSRKSHTSECGNYFLPESILHFFKAYAIPTQDNVKKYSKIPGKRYVTYILKTKFYKAIGAGKSFGRVFRFIPSGVRRKSEKTSSSGQKNRKALSTGLPPKKVLLSGQKKRKVLSSDQENQKILSSGPKNRKTLLSGLRRLKKLLLRLIGKKGSASLTVEASLAMPVFLSVMLLMTGLFQALSTYESIDYGLCTTVRRAAAYSVAEDGIKKSELVRIFYETCADSSVSTSYVSGGVAGIILTVPDKGEKNGILRLNASYRMKLPGFTLGKFTIKVKDSVCARVWTGLKLGSKQKDASDSDDSELVLVADNGTVYHTNENCTYLSLSIQTVKSDSLASRRNKYGSKYSPCEKCARGTMNQTVYITNQGTAWHNDKDCSGLKRSTRLMTKEKAQTLGLHACPRCSK